jgi:uncharacterized protein (TIGR03437 family)
VRALRLAATLAVASTLFAADIPRRRAPVINIGGVVNAASFTPAPENFVSPNAIISIFGIDLSLRTRPVRESDLAGGRLPLSLGGVSVLLNNQRLPLYFVSEFQINAQIPDNVQPGEWRLRVNRENLISVNEANVSIRAVAPGLFNVVVHPDFTLVGRKIEIGATATRPGRVIICFGTGMGQTAPFVFAGELPNFAAPIIHPVKAFLGGGELPRESILYAGQAPRLAGLYQWNILLPATIPFGDLELIVEVDGVKSQPGVFVAIDPSELSTF